MAPGVAGEGLAFRVQVGAAGIVVAAGCTGAVVAELALGAIGVFAALSADVRIAAMEPVAAGLGVRAGGVLRAARSIQAGVTAEHAGRADAFTADTVEVGIAGIVAGAAVLGIDLGIDTGRAAAGVAGIAIGVAVALGAERDATALVAGESRAAVGIGVAGRSVLTAGHAGAVVAGARAALIVGGAGLAPAGALIGAEAFVTGVGAALGIGRTGFSQIEPADTGAVDVATGGITDTGLARRIADFVRSGLAVRDACAATA